jgi:hypothetical protein
VPELPASVRLALWVTRAWAVGADASTVLGEAIPDADVVIGASERLALWRDLGERALYAALPRPGATGLLPGCGPEALDAATSAGEAVFVAGVGGLAVPGIVPFGADHLGSEGSGLAVRWDGYPADPVPVYRLAGLDVGAVDGDLRRAVHGALGELGDGGWSDAWGGPRAGSDGHRRVREWALPPDLPERVASLVVRAGAVLEVAEAGIDHASGSASVALEEHRREVLRDLRDVACAALEVAACVGADYLAAQSRRTRS